MKGITWKDKIRNETVQNEHKVEAILASIEIQLNGLDTWWESKIKDSQTKYGRHNLQGKELEADPERHKMT